MTKELKLQKKKQEFEVIKVNNDNIGTIVLDKKLSDMHTIGPIFEGMAHMKFSDKAINWTYITKDILSHYAPKIPFKYLVSEKDTVIEEKEPTPGSTRD